MLYVISHRPGGPAASTQAAGGTVPKKVYFNKLD